MDEDSISFGRTADRRDGPTLRDVFDTSYRTLVAQLYDVTGSLDEAEDAVREAFVRAAATERRFLRTDDPEEWLRAAAVTAHRRRRLTAALGRWAPWARSPHGRGTEPRATGPGFDALVRRGARRRMRRTRVAVAAYGLAVVTAASALAANDAPPPPSPATPTTPGVGPPELEEVGGRLPSGRAGMPALVAGAPATVSVAIPDDDRWRLDPQGSGIYSVTGPGAASIRLAAFLVDGVVGRPCRTPSVPASPGIPVDFVRPGVTPTALADAIAELPRADVLVPPHPVSRWGTTAVHLRLRVPRAACHNGRALWTFDTRRGGELLSNGRARLDYWVVEIHGHAVAIEAERPMGATAAEHRAMTALLDSIELHTEEEP